MKFQPPDPGFHEILQAYVFHSVVPRLAAGRRRARRCGPSAARDLPSCQSIPAQEGRAPPSAYRAARAFALYRRETIIGTNAVALSFCLWQLVGGERRLAVFLERTRPHTA